MLSVPEYKDHKSTWRLVTLARSVGPRSPSTSSETEKEVTFLGHQVSREGVRPDPANIGKVLNWPTPSNDVEAKGFLGLCGYYAKFIPEYAEVSKPLREAANQKGAILWTTELGVFFDKLK